MVVRQAEVAPDSDVFVIDLTTRPLAGGISQVALFLENLDVDSATVVTMKLNTLADGSGDDIVVDSKSLSIGDPQSLIIESDHTEFGFKTNQTSVESLVISVSGTVAGSAALIIKPMDCYFGMNPTAS